MRTPWPVWRTWRLCARIQSRTSLLMCQEALLQIMSNACLPNLFSFAQHQARYWVVMALIGRFSTNRSQTCSGRVSGAAGQETSGP